MEVKQPRLSRRIGLLLADDSDNDRFFIRRALADSPCLTVVGEVKDGVETVEYLAGYGSYKDRVQFPFPDLLLLDLNMSRMNGLEVLRWCQKQNFANLCIVVCSDSLYPKISYEAYSLGANYCKPKPTSIDKFKILVRELETIAREKGLAKKAPIHTSTNDARHVSQISANSATTAESQRRF